MRATAHSSSLLRVSEAARELGVSPQSIRNFIAAGGLDSVSTPGGHRRITRESIRRYLGYDEQSDVEDEGIPVCLCGRVSTSRQNQANASSGKSDLQRQVEGLREYVKSEYPTARVTEYVAVRSGLNFSDKVFVRMLRDIMAGKFRGGILVCTHRDRVCRLSGEFLTLICENGGVELVETDAESEKEFAESLAEEFMAISHVFSCRHYSRRGAVKNMRHVSEDCVERMVELREANMGIDSIVRTLNEEGYRMGKGQDQEKWTQPITEWVVLRYLENAGVQKGVEAKAEGEADILDEFIQENVEKTGDKADRLTGPEVRERYSAFCEERGLVPEERSVFGSKLVKKGFERKRTGKGRFYVGVRLKTA